MAYWMDIKLKLEEMVGVDRKEATHSPPKQPEQILPKDILVNARMISGKEAEKQIMDAVNRYSFYSSYNNTNQWMASIAIAGGTSSAWSNNTIPVMYTTWNPMTRSF